ncbi:hypothetical protein O7626_19070 [Micromonospora sp. WMMD1102]|uniref:hypothetical protein n=1 Tax=Micromonospora sp. WMMD1102 TaxID=3016105 RepID=UPI00241592EF|nr:hypothetical protein [Micromonospora sp. WMMD1102]MDG4788015.1 hypothetical protein [Micromonospora sp. WMMD1102]
MAEGLPSLNPFPVQATTAIEEGSFVESYRSWARSVPTLTVEPVRRLTGLAHRYRESFEAGERVEGQVAFVHGPHGAGKTHAIRAAVGLAATEVRQPRVLPLYVKLGSPNAVNAYRRLMAQLSIDELTDLALRFLGSLSAAAGPAPAGAVEKQLRDDPATLLTMFSDHVLERGLLLQAQADRLRTVVTGELDFQRALTYLLEPELKEAAYRWLQGRQLTDPELRQLGLSGLLDSPDQCRYGLQLLTLICTRAGRPLTLILDQAEKFLAQPDGRMVADSASFLHSLVEAVPDLGGMLVVAANDEIWRMLPDDLRQRFGVNDIACTALQPGQALELLGLYVLAAYGPQAPAGYHAPQPFTEDAVRKLLVISGGNPRSLLQLAWQSFDRLGPGQYEIDVTAVPDKVVRYERAQVEASVRRALWRLGPLVRDPEPGFQYAVALEGTGGLLVRIREASFYLEEAERAEDDIRARSSSTGDTGRLDRAVLVVIGYASEDVLHLLGGVYDDVVVYRDADSFAEQLLGLVHRQGGPDVGEDRRDYSGAYERLGELGWSRAVAADSITGAASAVARQDDAEHAARRFAELGHRWPAERDRLVGRIAEARRERERIELDELQRAADEYRRSRWRRRSLVAAAVPLAFAIFAVLTRLFTDSDVPPQFDLALGGLALALSILAAAVSFDVPRANPPRPVSLGAAERIARQRFFGRSTGSGSVAGPADLRAADPYRRYGALRVGLRGETSLQLLQALQVEQVAIIRRALAHRLGQAMSRDGGAILADTVLALDTDELPYLLEPYRSPYWQDIAGLPAPVLVPVLLANRYGRDIRTGRRAPQWHPGNVVEAVPAGVEEPDPAATNDTADPAATEETLDSGDLDPSVRLVARTAAGEGALGEAYTVGLTPDRLRRALDETHQEQLYRAARLVSPFEGVGVADHLTLADEIERLYLFLEQVLFYRRGGIGP